MRSLALAFLLAVAMTSTRAQASPISWEFAVDLAVLGGGDLDPGFESGAVLAGTIAFDPTFAEFLWADDFEQGAECPAGSIRCTYELPIDISATIDDHVVGASGVGTAVLTRDTSLTLSVYAFDYDGQPLRHRSTIGLALGYGSGFEPASFQGPSFESLPPEGFEHFFSMEFDPGSGSPTLVLGSVTAIALLPETSAASLLLMTGVSLLGAMVRRRG